MRLSPAQLVLLAALSLPASAAFAQDERCQLSLSEWEPLSFSHEHLRPGDTLFLSPEFLLMVRQQFADLSGSRVGYYTFLRPASRKEIRKSRTENTARERLGEDGNVYALVKAPAGCYLFSAPDGFEGALAPTLKEGLWIVPFGLSPFRGEQGPEQPFVVSESNARYLTLLAGGRTYAFYPAELPASSAFLRAEDIRLLETQRQLARSLRGREILVTPRGPLRIADDLNASQWREVRESFTCRITTIFVLRERVMIGVGGSDFLVVDGKSDGEIQLIGCHDPIWKNIFRAYPVRPPRN